MGVATTLIGLVPTRDSIGIAAPIILVVLRILLPARWQGMEHMAVSWGGTNPPTATASKETYLSSILAFASRMKRAGVDIELSDHAFADYGLERMEELRSAPEGPENPFILGTSVTRRFMEVMENIGRWACRQRGDLVTASAEPTTRSGW
ncbi:hypothetical protein [Streptomyces bullii]|uniref:Uncharacterized protein n=1 Tax=Streptomyces bullii TaxID=349910 RepID=A0ABW0V0Y3_9ACTN